MINKLPLLLAVLVLAGCQPKSEIDKCVEATMVVFKDRNPDAKQSESSNMAYLARLKCLKVQAGNG